MISLHAIAHGQVQGVSFRWVVQRRAIALGIRGTVRNLANGSVELIGFGERDQLEAWISQLKKEPLPIHVDRLDIEWGEAHSAPSGFEITF